MVSSPEDDHKSVARSKFQKHILALAWKSYLQRQRRWRIMVLENVFALFTFLVAIFIAKPVFLTTLEDELHSPIGFKELLSHLDRTTVLGFSPNAPPYSTIMYSAAVKLNINPGDLLSAGDEEQLNLLLYQRAEGKKINSNVTWILWQEKNDGVYRFKIRSTELARIYERNEASTEADHNTEYHNAYLLSGFLAIQAAVSNALLEHVAAEKDKEVNYKLSLRSIPTSPLMKEKIVNSAISRILMCYTIAMLPPVLETEALVVTESARRFKRALRIRSVDYFTMYLAWLVYGMLTALPICVLGSIALSLIFRWVHLFYCLIILFFYFMVMMMLALIMAMAHAKVAVQLQGLINGRFTAWISCVWTTSQTLLQTFMAELIVHHHLDTQSLLLSFIIQMFMPPLGLLNGLNEFALLRSGYIGQTVILNWELTIVSWLLLIFLYFMLLMLLQRTTSSHAIGGQVSWKSVVFKHAADPTALHPVAKPRPMDVNRLQQVDDFAAKAISFRGVSKSIMNVPVLSNITFDIYRGEFSLIVSERIQHKAINCVTDLLTGTTYADTGSINVLGVELGPGINLMTEAMMMGYCDQSSFLIDDLTVDEHFTLFADICLWKQSSEKILEYRVIRCHYLMRECDLEGLGDRRVRELGEYYRAQLCWAIAMLLEPRVIIIPYFYEDSVYKSVIKDKIVRYRKYVTIVKMSLSSMNMTDADRIFAIDNRVLAFGGTVAYMFFRYGREYRIRIETSKHPTNNSAMVDLLERLATAEAQVRAHIGTLLILRVPTRPTKAIAVLIKDIEDDPRKYGVVSINVSLPDPNEVFRRAVHESRASDEIVVPEETRTRSVNALARIENRLWIRQVSWFAVHIRYIGWKYAAFYIEYKHFFIITILVAIVAGAAIGYDLGMMVQQFDKENLQLAKIMTVEATNQKTTLTLGLDESDASYAIAQGYVISTTYATEKQAQNIRYIAISAPQSVTEFLATKAIDSPQDYVHLHAYGMDVKGNRNKNNIDVGALYNPVHEDTAAACRSIGRVYMALLRYYSGNMTAALEVTDDPLLIENWPTSADRALVIQFLLILTASHIVLIPSREYGLIRHTQSHASNFSPIGYWFSLALCDLILYWLLVVLMVIVGFGVFFFMSSHLQTSLYTDLLIVPSMLAVHGVGCVPQAYIFSLGSRPSLNAMAFFIINLVFGEATILAKLFYGNLYKHALSFMFVSPQFNMAIALLKIKSIFQHNSECFIFKENDICKTRMLHRCCPMCGVLQDCFQRKGYLEAMLPEIIGTFAATAIYMTLLMLLEYRIIQLVLNSILRKILVTQPSAIDPVQEGAMLEKRNAIEKDQQLRHKKAYKHAPQSTFGEFLLAVNVTLAEKGYYYVRNVYLGLGKGEALGLAGLITHGRLRLCKVLAGYLPHDQGRLYAMSRYRRKYSPHKYVRNVALCVEDPTLPDWMTVYDALKMVAVLRGVPNKHVVDEVQNFIYALDLNDQAGLLISRLHLTELKRLHFAAAVIGAPAILALDECSSYQDYVVRTAMYQILAVLRKRGHAILHCGFDIESHLPLTHRLAILRDGSIYDIDYVDNLLARHSRRGYVVVVHLKNEVDVEQMFSRYFDHISINDTTEVLVNVQVLDNMPWGVIFEKMEKLQEDNVEVYSYIVAANPIDYIYYDIISNDAGCEIVDKIFCERWLKNFLTGTKDKVFPMQETLRNLKSFEKRYGMDKLKELPWSVIFHR